MTWSKKSARAHQDLGVGAQVVGHRVGRVGDGAAPGGSR